VKIRIKISKNQWLKLAVFAALIGVAFVLDGYFKNNPVKIAEENSQQGHNAEQPGVYFFAQSTTINVKTTVQNTPDRKFFQQSHDKLLQKYHQLRNYQVLKTDAREEKEPLRLSHHFLVFRSYFYSFPDDVPLLS